MKKTVLYGKEGNYYFPCRNEKVFYYYTKEQESFRFCFDNVDDCIHFAIYQRLLHPAHDIDTIYIEGPDRYLLKFKTEDNLLEALWLTLGDVNIDDAERIEQNWFIFKKGTTRETIWHWFDEYHSKGVGWLMNDFDGMFVFRNTVMSYELKISEISEFSFGQGILFDKENDPYYLKFVCKNDNWEKHIIWGPSREDISNIFTEVPNMATQYITNSEADNVIRFIKHIM